MKAYSRILFVSCMICANLGAGCEQASPNARRASADARSAPHGQQQVLATSVSNEAQPDTVEQASPVDSVSPQMAEEVATTAESNVHRLQDIMQAVDAIVTETIHMGGDLLKTDYGRQARERQQDAHPASDDEPEVNHGR